MTTELKPCPFCGGDTKIETGDGPHPTFWLLCRSCAAEGPWAKSESAARGAWNRRADAYRPPFVAESVASGVAAEAIAADDATRETVGTRVIEAPAFDAADHAACLAEIERLREALRAEVAACEWLRDTGKKTMAEYNDALQQIARLTSTRAHDERMLAEYDDERGDEIRRRQAAEKERDGERARADDWEKATGAALGKWREAMKERDEARAEIARLADAVALYRSQQAADWARIAAVNKERDEARDVIRLHEEDEARVFTLCGVMPEDVRGDPAVAVERLKAERDEARAERDGLRDEVVAELGDIGHDYVRSPADGVRVLVSRLDDAIARAEKAEAELAASRASDAANRKQWRTETTWHLEKFEQIRTACSRALGDEAAGKGAVEAAIACAAKVVALQAELAARDAMVKTLREIAVLTDAEDFACFCEFGVPHASYATWDEQYAAFGGRKWRRAYPQAFPMFATDDATAKEKP